MLNALQQNSAQSLQPCGCDQRPTAASSGNSPGFLALQRVAQRLSCSERWGTRTLGAQSSRFRRPWWSPRLGTALAVFGGASCGWCGVAELKFRMQILEQYCQELHRFRGRNCLRLAGETSGLLRGDGTSPLQCYHAKTSQQKMDPTQSTARGLCSKAHRPGPSARELGPCFGTCVQGGVTGWQRPASDGCGLRYPQGEESGSLNLGGLTGNLCMVTIMDSVTSFPLVIYDRKCAPRKHTQTGPPPRRIPAPRAPVAVNHGPYSSVCLEGTFTGRSPLLFFPGTWPSFRLEHTFWA
jgi:hypothetical protein